MPQIFSTFQQSKFLGEETFREHKAGQAELTGVGAARLENPRDMDLRDKRPRATEFHPEPFSLGAAMKKSHAASIAMGTGDIDCAYHAALVELEKTATRTKPTCYRRLSAAVGSET